MKATAYFARVVSYVHKMFIKLCTGDSFIKVFSITDEESKKARAFTSGLNVIKLFTIVVNEFSYIGVVFMPGKPLLHSLMFGGKQDPTLKWST
jgi:hypothetical protein